MLYHLKHPDFPDVKFKVIYANFLVLIEGPEHFGDEVAILPPALAALLPASPMPSATRNTERMARASTTSKSNQTFHAMEECWADRSKWGDNLLLRMHAQGINTEPVKVSWRLLLSKMAHGPNQPSALWP